MFAAGRRRRIAGPLKCWFSKQSDTPTKQIALVQDKPTVTGEVHRCLMARKAREERRTILPRVRLRADAGWSEVTIVNVSSRGLMFRCPSPPERGSFIEIRHRGASIVGRVAWSRGSRCGIRTQDRLDIQELLAPSPIRPRRSGEVRQETVRRPPHKSVQLVGARAEQSHRFAVIFNWSVIALAGAGAGFFVVGTMRTALDRPLDVALYALSQSSR